MLETIIQVTAAVGPICLAIMGVAVSLRPPSAIGIAHYIWAVAFFIIGAISACAIFIEIRGTDKTLEELRLQVAELKKASQRGPRLEFAGVKSSKDDESAQTTSINLTNTSDVDIIDYFLIGGAYLLASEPDDAFFNSLRDRARKADTSQATEFHSHFKGNGNFHEDSFHLGYIFFCQRKQNRYIFIYCSNLCR